MANTKKNNVDNAEILLNENADIKEDLKQFVDVGVEKEEANEKTKIVESEDSEIKSILFDIQSGIKDVTQKDIVANTKTTAVKIAPDELIAVISMVRGGFNWRCAKSGIWYRWSGMGHVELMPYDDLYQMYTNAKQHLIKPSVIVEDERIIKGFKLAELYKDMAVAINMKNSLNNVEAMERDCQQAIRLGMRDLFIERLCQMRTNGILNNIDVITVAEDILKCEISKK